MATAGYPWGSPGSRFARTNGQPPGPRSNGEAVGAASHWALELCKMGDVGPVVSVG